jgi:hypothetical protein
MIALTSAESLRLEEVVEAAEVAVEVVVVAEEEEEVVVGEEVEAVVAVEEAVVAVLCLRADFFVIFNLMYELLLKN